jgi:YHS domain-containing protein
MNTFLCLIATPCIAAVIILAGNSSVGASDMQALDLAKSTSEKGPDIQTQDGSQNTAKSDSATKVNVDSQGVIVNGYDVVAYFKQGKPVKGNPTFESTYQGARYLFSSLVDKADFDKDPAKYAPRYGAFCSYGVTMGVLADLEGPDAFAIYKGRLYLCGNQGALKEFKTDIDSNIGKADTNWRLLAGP